MSVDTRRGWGVDVPGPVAEPMARPMRSEVTGDQLRTLARGCGLIAMAIGAVVLVAALLGIDAVLRPGQGLPRMPASGAVLLVACGGVLADRARPRGAEVPGGDGVSRVIAGLAFVVALLRLLDDSLHVHVGLDRLLRGHVAHTSPHASIAFLLLAGTLLALPAAGAPPSRARDAAAAVSTGLVVAATAVVALALVGYALGVGYLRGSHDGGGIAPYSLVGLALLTGGILALRPDDAPASWFTRHGAGEVAARRMIWPSLLFPLGLGGVLVLGQRASWFGDDVALAAMVVGAGVVAQVLIVIGVRGVREHEAERLVAESARRKEVRRFDALASRTPVGIFELDRNGRALRVNAAWSEMSGLDEAAALGGGWLRALHPEDRGRLVREWTSGEHDGLDRRSEHRFVRPDGSIRWIVAQSRPLLDEEGTVTGYIGSSLDVTEWRHAEQEARDAEERFRLAFDLAPTGIALVAPDGRFLRVNAALAAMLGRTPAELLETTAQAVTHPDDVEAEQPLAARLLAGELRSYEIEKRAMGADGTALWTLTSASLVREEDGTPRYFVALVQDVSDRRRDQEQLRFLAEHDELTGLSNRRQLDVAIAEAVARSHRGDDDSALFVMDLDGFKAINDTHGHAVGDEAIRTVAGVLRARLRSTDVVARMGGDEFAVLLHRASAVDAERLAGDVVSRLSAASVQTADGPVHLGVSLGLAVTSDVAEGADPGDLLHQADVAMYQAKRAGGGGWRRAGT